MNRKRNQTQDITVLQSVFTHVASSHVNVLEQKDVCTYDKS